MLQFFFLLIWMNWVVWILSVWKSWLTEGTFCLPCIKKNKKNIDKKHTQNLLEKAFQILETLTIRKLLPNSISFRVAIFHFSFWNLDTNKMSFLGHPLVFGYIMECFRILFWGSLLVNFHSCDILSQSKILQHSKTLQTPK